MTRQVEFDFTKGSFATGRIKTLIDAFTTAWRKDLSITGTVTTLHQSHPNVKHVVHVRNVNKLQETTIYVKFYDGETLTIRHYPKEVNDVIDLPRTWTTVATIKDGEVTLH